MRYGEITKGRFSIKPIGLYVERKTNLKLIENKNPKYKDYVILLKSPIDDKCSIPRFSVMIDMYLNQIELLDLDDTTLYRAGLQSRHRFNLITFKEVLDKVIKEYNNIAGKTNGNNK